MRCLSLDGGQTYYDPYNIDIIADEIFRLWDQILFLMDPDVKRYVEEHCGTNRGDIIFLQDYLKYAQYDLVICGWDY